MQTPPRGRRFTPIRIAIFLAIIIGWIIWDGSEKIPEPPSAGTNLFGPAPVTRPNGNTIRVATFNIAGGVGAVDDRFDLDRTASCLQGFDLIGLQELHGGLPFVGTDQAELLGKKLGMPWLFAPIEKQWWRDAFGDGVITSLRLIHWQRFQLAYADTKADSNRGVLILRLELAGKPLNVLITHLDRSKTDHDAELRSVISLFQSFEPPVILMGDLNSYRDDPQILAVQSMPDVADPIGENLKNSKETNVDWIFARGMHTVDAGIIEKGASDHPLRWAALQLN